MTLNLADQNTNCPLPLPISLLAVYDMDQPPPNSDPMAFISIDVEVDSDQILESLFSPSNSNVNLIEFVKSIDEEVADEGFTIELIKALTDSMIKEYEGALEHYASRSLEAGFNPASSGVNSLSHCSEAWDDSMRSLNVFNGIKSLLSQIEQ